MLEESLTFSIYYTGIQYAVSIQYTFSQILLNISYWQRGPSESSSAPEIVSTYLGLGTQVIQTRLFPEGIKDTCLPSFSWLYKILGVLVKQASKVKVQLKWKSGSYPTQMFSRCTALANVNASSFCKGQQQIWIQNNLGLPGCLFFKKMHRKKSTDLHSWMNNWANR